MPDPSPTRPNRPWHRDPLGWVRRHPLIALGVYAALLIANWIALGEANLGRRQWGEEYMRAAGARHLELDAPVLPVRERPLTYWVATRGDPTDPAHPPVLLLHGSPGGANGFTSSFGNPGLVEEFTGMGRAVIWLDLPGYASAIDPSANFTSYSADAYARVMLAVLDELGVERAHAVGWSNGGAVALRMIERDPERVASLTLLASVGVQETEGSGSYLFEHAKYAIGQAFLNVGGYLIPQFGAFGPPAETRAFLANFQQTDQRTLRPVMESLTTPTLILHGRNDFLTPHWGAELHHELIPTSRLVMLDASHFIPFWQAREGARIMESHFERHDTPGVAPLTDYDNRAPLPERTGVARAIEWLGEHIRWTPWWILVPIIAVLAYWRPELATVLAGMYVGRVDLDIGVAFLGLLAGRLARPRTPFDGRRLPLGWIGTALWSFLSLGIVFVCEQDTIPVPIGPDDLTLRFGAFGLIAWIVLWPLGLHAVRNLPRRRGRQRVRAQLTRLRRHEYWPAWTHYLGVAPIWASRLFKPGGALAFTALNPAIPRAGGLVGESKTEILEQLSGEPEILSCARVEPEGTPAERAARALALIESRAGLGGLPIICKPDVGEHGADVKLARTPDDVRRYFELARDTVVLQRYHPGPSEFGVLWARDPSSLTGQHTSPDTDTPLGRVRWITRKVFPFVEGDGVRTLGDLILAHPRHRCQAGVFFERFRARTREVVPAGERVRLAHAGNHRQGTEFRDGDGVTTPELERVIDRLARACEGAGGLDVGRFDIRCESDEALARGEGLAVIELNGVSAEPTNSYDPDRSILWAWRVMRAHWRGMYALADARIAGGAKPLNARQVFALTRQRRRASGTTD